MRNRVTETRWCKNIRTIGKGICGVKSLTRTTLVGSLPSIVEVSRILAFELETISLLVRKLSISSGQVPTLKWKVTSFTQLPI
jgi:hypothetical protein